MSSGVVSLALYAFWRKTVTTKMPWCYLSTQNPLSFTVSETAVSLFCPFQEASQMIGHILHVQTIVGLERLCLAKHRISTQETTFCMSIQGKLDNFLVSVNVKTWLIDNFQIDIYKHIWTLPFLYTETYCGKMSYFKTIHWWKMTWGRCCAVLGCSLGSDQRSDISLVVVLPFISCTHPEQGRLGPNWLR
jgi:hypothetical protein